jgi:hypothetical protein
MTITASDLVFLNGLQLSGPATVTSVDSQRLASIGSTAGADFSQLTLVQVDLRDTRFAGSYNLERLQIQGVTQFRPSPRGTFFGIGLPPVWRWTRRQTLVEEHEWRRTTRKSRGWATREQLPAVTPTEAERRQVILILRGDRDRLEAEYRLKVSDEVLEEVADLALQEEVAVAVEHALFLVERTAARLRTEGLLSSDAAAHLPVIKDAEARLTSVREGKEQAIENQLFEEAAAFRDQERSLVQAIRGAMRLEPEVLRALRAEHGQSTVNRLVAVRLERLLAPVNGEAREGLRQEESDLLADCGVDFDEQGEMTPEDVRATARDVGAAAIEPEVVTQAERESPNPGAISDLYRALRKGLEDSHDAPGAADFYYGEMEMRRHDPDTSQGERTLLFAYWLVSGYGLRTTRALMSLAATIVVFAWAFRDWGFARTPTWSRALLFTSESTTSLFRPVVARGNVLTQDGEILSLVLRLLGPLFLGFAVLSLRGRVKR